MYVPKYHAWTDQDAMQALIEAHALGSWVCHSDEGLVGNHVSRANGVWRQLNPDVRSIVMFQGPQSYITPGWYPGKTQHGKVVPTWNYAAVHVHGTARVVDDREWLLDMLRRLTDAQEANRAKPWRVADAPSDFIDQMLRAIVGIEIPIDRLQGRLKLSQDEDLQDRLGTLAGLRSNPDPASQELADWVSKSIDAAGKPVQ